MHPPQPRVPILPVLDWASLSGGQDAPHSPFLGPDSLRLVNGRSALAYISQRENLQGQSVLLPAYHCRTMVEPIVWSGAEPLFYRINADLSPDWEHLESLARQDTRAILFAHYFGFPQDLAKIQRFCRSRQLLFIEDCSHALFSHSEGRPLGTFGDYAIASLWKFFPVAEGGSLLGYPKHDSPPPPGYSAEAKIIYRALVRAASCSRWGLTGRVLAGLDARRSRPHQAPTAATVRSSGSAAAQAGAESGGGDRFRPNDLDRGPSRFDNWIIRRSIKDRRLDNRRKHYVTLLEAVGALPACRALFPELPEGVSPYMFPLVLNKPDRDFPALKKAGMPIWRWEQKDLSSDNCPQSLTYSRSLIQLPCHQGLKPLEIQWMTDTLNRILGEH